MTRIVLLLIPVVGLALAGMPAFVTAPPAEVAAATRAVLNEMNLPVAEADDVRLVSIFAPIDPDALSPFVLDAAPAEGDGWQQARLGLSVVLAAAENGMRLEVSAAFARFGVPSALLLIPPTWYEARSNGRLEAALVAAIRARLSGKPSPVPLCALLGVPVPGAAGLNNPPFIPNVAASKDTSAAGNQNETTIGLVPGGIVVGGWNDNRAGVYHVGFNRSTDFGATWATPDTLMDYHEYSEDGDPVICVDDSGVVYYFWLSFNRSPQAGDIVLAKSSDGGLTWGPTLNVTPGSPSTLDDKPWATIDGNNVFLSWCEFPGGTMKFKRSADRGATWTSGVTVGSGGNGSYPFRGTDSTVYVGWGMQDIRLNKSTDMGRTWQGQRTIITCPWSPGSTPWRMNNIPCFGTSLDRTRLYVVFADSRNANNQTDVFFSRSTDQGATWSTPLKLNDTPTPDTTRQFYPWLAVDPFDRLHAVWHDTRAGMNRIGQYYAYSTDFGVTWSQNYRVSDTAVYASTFIGDYNACAADSWRVYALWCDARRSPSNPDVFHSHAFHLAPGPRDVGVAAILDPAGTVDSGTVVTPKALITNYGTALESLSVVFAIDDGYSDTTSLTLAPGASDTAFFADWPARLLGWFATRCTTILAGDANPANDLAADSFEVIPLTGITAGTEVPGRLALKAPSPTPAGVKLTYYLPQPARVRLALHDATGRQTALLADCLMPAGKHEAVLAADRIPTGAYIARLTADGQVLSRKLIVHD